MLHKHASRSARAVTAAIKPPFAHQLGYSFPAITPLSWCRERIDPGVRPVHLSIVFGDIESTSTALYLTITGDRLQAAAQRSARLATSLSTDGMP